MISTLTIQVVGEGYAPYLIAALLARFGPQPEAIGVSVRESTAEDQPVVVHPKAFQWLRAIGIDHDVMTKAGAVSLRSWGGESAIPFFVQGNQRPGLQIRSSAYCLLLKKICENAGVQEQDQKGTITVSTSAEEEADIQASIPTALHADLTHLAVLEAARSMAFAIPGRPPVDAELRELQRLASRSHEPLRDMSDLLSNAKHTERVAHRVAIWKSIGRVYPCDDDPFSNEEWKAALSAKVTEPGGRPLIQQVKERHHG